MKVSERNSMDNINKLRPHLRYAKTTASSKSRGPTKLAAERCCPNRYNESSILYLTFTYKNSLLYRVSTPLVISMGVFTHTHKAIHNKGNYSKKTMSFLESIVTRLS